MDNPQKKISSNDRFVRWQSVTREHITFTVNLLLTLALATVGFILSELSKMHLETSVTTRRFLVVGLILVVISILFGAVLSFIRLKDFRATTQKIKNELTGGQDIQWSKAQMHIYGQLTWFLIYWQLRTFLIGILSIITALALYYSNTLFW